MQPVGQPSHVLTYSQHTRNTLPTHYQHTANTWPACRWVLVGSCRITFLVGERWIIDSVQHSTVGVGVWWAVFSSWTPPHRAGTSRRAASHKGAVGTRCSSSVSSACRCARYSWTHTCDPGAVSDFHCFERGKTCTERGQTVLREGRQLWEKDRQLWERADSSERRQTALREDRERTDSSERKAGSSERKTNSSERKTDWS